MSPIMQSAKSFSALWLRSRMFIKPNVPHWSFVSPLLNPRESGSPRLSKARGMSVTKEGIQPRAESILKYWLGPIYESKDHFAFDPEVPKKWFMGGPKVDEEISRLFGDDLQRVENGEYKHWKEHPYNALALIIIMDQFVRTIYRGSSKMCSLDDECFGLAKQMVENGAVKELKVFERTCVYLPYMHREDLQAQKDCVVLYEELKAEVERDGAAASHSTLIGALAQSKSYAQHHLDVVEKYGRFPHRNVLLGRANTPKEEMDFKEGKIPQF